MESVNRTFAFKELKVWQKALDFTDHVILLSENLTAKQKHFRLIEQLESASASIPQNIAEGKGRRSKKEFIQFLYIARGSLYEVITLLNLFNRRKWIKREDLDYLENDALQIASMIKGLINSLYN